MVAIKRVDKSSLSKSAVDNLITEINLLKILKHEHIVEMRDFFWDEGLVAVSSPTDRLLRALSVKSILNAKHDGGGIPDIGICVLPLIDRVVNCRYVYMHLPQ